MSRKGGLGTYRLVTRGGFLHLSMIAVAALLHYLNELHSYVMSHVHSIPLVSMKFLTILRKILNEKLRTSEEIFETLNADFLRIGRFMRTYLILLKE